MGKGPGDWVCGACHPHPDPEHYKEPVIKYPEGKQPAPAPAAPLSELDLLKARVASGNLKLIAAWEQIKDLMEDEFEPAFAEWQAALERLSRLCENLKLTGFEDCLYIENNVKTRECSNRAGDIVCWACPSKRKYWDEELFVGARRYVRHPIKFPVDFLKTLGGKV
ncbi:MAG: hypothetical protein Q8O57_10085 [Kiritimatiellota bacterium]|nr:hypothetical protein [Kiritimatiellota bacterium]